MGTGREALQERSASTSPRSRGLMVTMKKWRPRGVRSSDVLRKAVKAAGLRDVGNCWDTFDNVVCG